MQTNYYECASAGEAKVCFHPLLPAAQSGKDSLTERRERPLGTALLCHLLPERPKSFLVYAAGAALFFLFVVVNSTSAVSSPKLLIFHEQTRDSFPFPPKELTPSLNTNEGSIEQAKVCLGLSSSVGFLLKASSQLQFVAFLSHLGF